MRTIQNLKVALFEALEREQALIEALEHEIGDHFEGRDAALVTGWLHDYLDNWDNNRYIPSMSYLKTRLEEGKEKTRQYLAKKEAEQATSS